MTLTIELVKDLSGAARCRPAIMQLADQLSDLSVEGAGLLVGQLIEQGEDVALSRLLNVCVFNDLRLDPGLLGQSVGVVADIRDIPYCFKRHDGAAIAPLLASAKSEEISSQRQAMVLRIAAELAIRHHTAEDDVKQALLVLHQDVPRSGTEMMVLDSLHLLNTGTCEDGLFPMMTELDLLSELPERPPLVIMGDGNPIRRPVPKLGRNDPCHCGSGKKYKRCCFVKDQETIRDASSYEGITRTEIRENPGIVDDPKLILQMRAYEVKKLKPEALSTNQLIAAAHRAGDFSLFDIALSMLIEHTQRTDAEYVFDTGHFYDLMHRALDHGDTEIARRARELVSPDFEYANWKNVDFQFALQENPGLLDLIEKRCRVAFSAAVNEHGFREHEFCELSHMFRQKFPALSILFSRAAVLECPDRHDDNELLMDNVHQARLAIGLDPWGDPFDESFELAEAATEQATEQAAESKAYERELDDLRQQVAQARQQTTSSLREISKKEAAIRDLKGELELLAGTQESSAIATPDPESKSRAEIDATLVHLRTQVSSLKAEISNKQEVQRRLRRELERERRAPSKAPAEARDSVTGDEPAMPSGDERKILLPEYDSAFRSATLTMPSAITAKALTAVAAFAAYDSAIWRHTRGLKQLRDIYRIRIGIHHRLLLRWQPGHSLIALDLIPRQDLESWIKRHA